MIIYIIFLSLLGYIFIIVKQKLDKQKIEEKKNNIGFKTIKEREKQDKLRKQKIIGFFISLFLYIVFLYIPTIYFFHDKEIIQNFCNISGYLWCIYIVFIITKILSYFIETKDYIKNIIIEKIILFFILAMYLYLRTPFGFDTYC